MMLRWPTDTLGPVPSLQQAAVLSWCFTLVLLVLPLGIAIHRQDPAKLDADFVSFYVFGRILNEYPHSQLYDYNLQEALSRQVHPLEKGEYGPVSYPPAVAIAFQPLAVLPYAAAYKIWLAITAALYVSAVVLLSRSLFPAQGPLRWLLLCASLAFFPFVIETLIGGQLSAVGFFAVTMAILEDREQRPFRGGIWLSVGLYKVTLLIWIVPMLLITRRWRTVTGFCSGAVGFLLLTTAIAGHEVWTGYARGLAHFSTGLLRHVEAPNGTLYSHPFWKYVDITAFVSLLTGGMPGFSPAVFVAAALVLAAIAARAWRKSANHDLVWATAVSATLVVNLHTPIYDATFAVIGIMLTISGAWTKATQNTRLWLMALLLSIFAVSWEAVALAEATRVQFMTLLFIGLGILQFRALAGQVAHTASLPPISWYR